MKGLYVLVGCGLLVGVIAWMRTRQKANTVSQAWIDEQHRWATDRSAQYEGVNSHWPWNPNGDNEAA